jgi:uncharacterized protein (TIGR01777 family)
MKKLRVAISGSSGLIGTALIAHLEKEGHAAVKLVRGEPPAGAIAWDPARETIGALDGFDAVVHLAGENIGEGRWTDDRKRVIVDSRVKGTRTIAKAVAERPSIVLVSASAVGIYGDASDPVDETSPIGTGFLAEVCTAWEAAADPAREAGVRVVHPRIGLVLAQEGGALSKMLPPFRMGVGGKIGSGAQWMSWIALEDTVRAIMWCLTDPRASGPVNVVGPNPVTNADFTKALGKALHRPTLFPAPKFALRAMFGAELANELLRTGQHVVPKKLRDAGVEWRDPDLDAALARLLG